MPSEAQWEYACRAGTATPWSCLPADLPRIGNFADAAARTSTNWPLFETWNDHFVAHAPVGSFLPNAFGLFDMHGNVSEWCRDEFALYSPPPRGGDGLRQGADERLGRIQRGGAFHQLAKVARSAQRSVAAKAQVAGATGLRGARALRPQ